MEICECLATKDFLPNLPSALCPCSVEVFRWLFPIIEHQKHKCSLGHQDGVPPENLEVHRKHLGHQWSLSSSLILQEYSSNFQNQPPTGQPNRNFRGTEFYRGRMACTRFLVTETNSDILKDFTCWNQWMDPRNQVWLGQCSFKFSSSRMRR